VLVVGAGPAGSIAALVLARAGVRVGVVDRSAFPRDKLCGDTLNPGALSILDRLGIGAAVRQQALPIIGMTVTGPRHAAVTGSYPEDLNGLAILRRDFDGLLLDAAIAAGAELSCGVRVRAPVTECGRVVGVETDEGPVRARVVIAADGRRSTLAFALGLAAFARAPRRWAFGTYFEGVDGLTSRGEMHIRSDGYIGVAPLPGGVTNVCVVRGRGAPWRARTPASIVDDAIGADPDLRERFRRARQVAPLATLGPLAVDARAAGCPGLLLAGDAAGFVDPMTGDGLRFALRGGELAAAAALEEIASGTAAFAALQSARVREFSRKWRINRALRSLVGSPAGISLAATVAARWGAPVEYLIGVAGDCDVARA